MRDGSRMDDTAVLSSRGEYTTFTYGDQTLTFLTSRNLERYLKVVEWDRGYLVVLAKNHGKPAHEDYIDLVPILENLYMDADSFLEPIKEVRIEYAGGKAS